MQVREVVTSLAASVDGNEFVLSGISLPTTLTAGQKISCAGHVQTGRSWCRVANSIRLRSTLVTRLRRLPDIDSILPRFSNTWRKFLPTSSEQRDADPCPVPDYMRGNPAESP